MINVQSASKPNNSLKRVFESRRTLPYRKRHRKQCNVQEADTHKYTQNIRMKHRHARAQTHTYVHELIHTYICTQKAINNKPPTHSVYRLIAEVPKSEAVQAGTGVGKGTGGRTYSASGMAINASTLGEWNDPNPFGNAKAGGKGRTSVIFPPLSVK